MLVGVQIHYVCQMRWGDGLRRWLQHLRECYIVTFPKRLIPDHSNRKYFSQLEVWYIWCRSGSFDSVRNALLPLKSENLSDRNLIPNFARYNLKYKSLRRNNLKLSLQHWQSCEMSILLHGAQSSDQILPQQKRINRDSFGTWIKRN